MKDTDFERLLNFKIVNGVLYPLNDKALDYCLINSNDEVYLIPQTQRDLSLHACYFVFCGWIWEQLPTKFKLERCPNKHNMYKYLKLVQGEYDITMKYKDIEAMEFKSISFGRMSNDQFKDFVNEQIISLYENILIPLGLECLYDKANEEFKKLFKELI